MFGFGKDESVELKVLLDSYGVMPERAHDDDAGWDLAAGYDFVLHPHCSLVVNTGVHIFIPKGYVGFLKSKSGLLIKAKVKCDGGVVDSGYTGEIAVKLHSMRDTDKAFRRGDKIVQIVFLPVPKTTLKLVESMPETERGANGFGSSGWRMTGVGDGN